MDNDTTAAEEDELNHEEEEIPHQFAEELEQPEEEDACAAELTFNPFIPQANQGQPGKHPPQISPTTRSSEVAPSPSSLASRGGDRSGQWKRPGVGKQPEQVSGSSPDWRPPAALGRPPKSDLRKAISRTKAGSAKGACYLDKGFVQELPGVAQNTFVDLVDICWLVAALPTTALMANICLLDKPTGGFRPIALLTMVYRWMLRQSRCWTKPWDEAHSGPWDYATPGKGVEAGIY